MKNIYYLVVIFIGLTKTLKMIKSVLNDVKVR